jgi:hypothetical protein
MPSDAGTLDLLAKLAQIVVAVVVGYVAWLARRDAKRNSISGLLKLVADQRNEYSKDYGGVLAEVMLANSGFASKPEEYKRFTFNRLKDLHSAKRGLDIAYEKLLVEADAAWGLGQSLQRQMEGMNRESDAEFNKLFAELQEQHP